MVVAGAVVTVYFLINKGPSYVVTNEESTNPSPSSNISLTAKTPAKKSAVATVLPGTTAYSDLVKQYEGKRIQFDDRCQAIPLMPTYKNGTSIMLDNRSSSPRVIKIGSVSYSLVGYGYRVVTLNSPSLPQELSVSCGSSNNVSKILLQAIISQ